MRKSSLLLLTSAAGCWQDSSRGLTAGLEGSWRSTRRGTRRRAASPGDTWASSQFRGGDLCNAEMLRLVRTARAWKSYFCTAE